MGGETLGVVGLGTMGLGIAQVMASAGFTVLATDAFAPARENARDRMAAALAARVEAGKLAPEAAQEVLARLRIVAGPGELAPCALVVEAIIEDCAAKQALFSALEAVLAPGAILATNTSSVPVHQVAEGLAHPERVLAAHFFNPPTAMKLVELAPHAGTAPAALDLARALLEACGKTVVECPDRPGFIVNRCARPYYGEALALLEEGRTAVEIDAAMVAVGYRLGPFALIDLIGADVNLAATEGVGRALGGHPRYHIYDALRAQVAAGHLGRKSGQGFVFPAAAASTPPADAAAIALRIESMLVNEAFWLLAEGGVAPAGIDTAMRLGLNFPRGPFEAMERHGASAVRAELARLAAVAPPGLAARYAPAPGLIAA